MWCTLSLTTWHKYPMLPTQNHWLTCNYFHFLDWNAYVLVSKCRSNIEVWLRAFPSCSSCSSTGFCSWMEWKMGWIWWAVLVFLIVFNFSHLSFLENGIILCYLRNFYLFFYDFTGTWLCLLFHLYAMWQPFHSPDFSSISLPLQDMIVGLTLSSSWWLWFSSLCLLLSHCIRQWVSKFFICHKEILYFSWYWLCFPPFGNPIYRWKLN